MIVASQTLFGFDSPVKTRYDRPMTNETDTSRLSLAEYIRRAGKLRDQPNAVPNAVPSAQAQSEELDRRLKALDAGAMEVGGRWDVVRERIWRQ
jgi:hypothetical protein